MEVRLILGEVQKIAQEDLALLTKCVSSAVKSCDCIISNIGFSGSVELDGYGVPQLKLHGGLNGRGQWNLYFNILSCFVTVLKTYYGIDVWLEELRCDVPDDVFDATFGVRFKKESIKSEEITDEDIYDIGNLVKMGFGEKV